MTTDQSHSNHQNACLVTDTDGRLCAGPDIMLRPRLAVTGASVRLTLAESHYRLEGVAADACITFDVTELEQYNASRDNPAVFTRMLILPSGEDMPLTWDPRLKWANGLPPSFRAGRIYYIALRYGDGELVGSVEYHTGIDRWLPPLEGLVSYWDFRIATPARVPDLAGGGNHMLPISGAAGCKPIVSGAGVFDFTTPGFKSAIAGMPVGTSAGSIFVICRPSVANETIVALSYGSAHGTAERAAGVWNSKINNLMFNAYSPGQPASELLGEPSLIVCTYGEGAGKATIYRDDYDASGERYQNSFSYPSNQPISENIFNTANSVCTLGIRCNGQLRWKGEILCAGVLDREIDPRALFEWARQNRLIEPITTAPYGSPCLELPFEQSAEGRCVNLGSAGPDGDALLTNMDILPDGARAVMNGLTATGSAATSGIVPINPSGPFTVEVVAEALDAAYGNNILMQYGVPENPGNEAHSIHFFGRSKSSMEMGGWYQTHGYNYPVGKRVFTLTFADGVYRGYIDGIFKTTWTSAGGLVLTPTQMFIGSRTNRADQFRGTISLARVCNEVLDAAHVRSNARHYLARYNRLKQNDPS